MLSGSVFFRSRHFPEMTILLRFCSVRLGKLVMGWPLSSNIEFEVKIETKSFVLSVEEYMTSGRIIIVSTIALPPFVIWWGVFQN